jgi:hypothetical protein
MISFQTAFAFITVSIHRLSCVVYDSNIFFLTKRNWVLSCIVSQWVSIYILIVGIVLLYEILFRSVVNNKC